MFTSFSLKNIFYLAVLDLSCGILKSVAQFPNQIQPTFPALQGGCLITDPTRKSPHAHVHTFDPDQLDDSVSAKGDHS